MAEGAAIDISVIVPVFRNASTLTRLATQVFDVIGLLGLNGEIVFVN